MKIICSKCNNEIIGTPKFCRKCGASKEYFIEDRPQEELSFCPECGHKCEALDMFCPECGYKLNEESNQIDEWDNNDSINDEWNSDIELDIKDDWGTALKNLKNFEEDDILKEFEYKKNTKGEVTITKVKDEYALIINVPSGVTVIGNSAFEGSSAIKITLPNGITTIGKRAFANCSNLKELIVPSSVIMIGDEAFKDSPNLDVSIPSNVMIIGKDITKGTLTEIKEEQKLKDEHDKMYIKCIELIKDEKYEDAIPYINIGIEQGNPDSFCKLGYCYEKLNDMEKSLINYQKAVELGNVEAIYRLANCYLRGVGLPQNIEMAIKYFEKAGENKYPHAYEMLGDIYINEKFISKNRDKAIEYYEKSLKILETPNLQYKLAKVLVIGDRAIELYTKSAESGYSDSMLELGKIYTGNIPVYDSIRKKYYDIDKALYWYGKAITEYKNIHAAYDIIFYKIKFSSDYYKNALDLLNDSDEGQAKYYLAKLYMMDLIGFKRYDVALLNFEKAVDKGVFAAYYDIILLCANSCFGVVDPVKAYKHALKARDIFYQQLIEEPSLKVVKEKYVRIIDYLVSFYAKGFGVKKDEMKACSLIKETLEIVENKKYNYVDSDFMDFFIKYGSYAHHMQYYYLIFKYNGRGMFSKTSTNQEEALKLMKRYSKFNNFISDWLKKHKIQ